MGSTKGFLRLFAITCSLLILLVLASGCLWLKSKVDAATQSAQQTESTAAAEEEESTPSLAEQAAADVAAMEDEAAGEDEDGEDEEGAEDEEGSEEEGDDPEDDPEEIDPHEVEEALPPGVEIPEPDPNIDVHKLYQARQCASCHGDNREGTKSGPPLKNLGQFWEIDDLEKFLQSPGYYLDGNKRLIEVGRKYNLLMPPSHMTRPQRYAIAHWLLDIGKQDEPDSDSSEAKRPLRPKHKTGGGRGR